jgi:2-iminobutanoate/2-iminopropanoate deaminase
MADPASPGRLAGQVNIVKLQGSFNWRSADGRNLLVVGRTRRRRCRFSLAARFSDCAQEQICRAGFEDAGHGIVTVSRGRPRACGCRARTALPDCNSRDRSGILGADEHLRREKSMAMKIDRIQPAGMNVRMQQGKPAYSHVVTVTGPGKTIYIAGQLARDAEGNIVGPGDMRAQLEQTFKNLDACLKAAGATWADVVKTNTFVTDYQAFSQCSDVRMRYFGVASPTSTTIRISGLAQPEAMVEIEMIAVVE